MNPQGRIPHASKKKKRNGLISIIFVWVPLILISLFSLTSLILLLLLLFFSYTSFFVLCCHLSPLSPVLKNKRIQNNKRTVSVELMLKKHAEAVDGETRTIRRTKRKKRQRIRPVLIPLTFLRQKLLSSLNEHLFFFLNSSFLSCRPCDRYYFLHFSSSYLYFILF